MGFSIYKLKDKLKVKEPIPKKHGKPKHEVSKRALDIMKTLSEKELMVVNFLLQNKNIGTQAQIKNNTGIPKTTLIRVLDSLKNKKVVEIEVIGKLKKVKLTSWFLGK